MRIALVYNEPQSSYYGTVGEEAAAAEVVAAARAVQEALQELGHQTFHLSLALPKQAARRKLEGLDADLIFNLFEGFCGYPESEPDIPAMLTELGKSYTGCPPQALKLGLNKAEAKRVLKSGGIDTPDSQLLDVKSLPFFNLRFPCIVKPNSEDASHGLTAESVVYEGHSLKQQLERVVGTYGGEKALVEEFIDGREFNATVMGNGKGRVLEISEIGFRLPPDLPRIVTYAGKWDSGSEYHTGTPVICPAAITQQERAYIAGVAERSYELIGCRGYARVDMRMDQKGLVQVLEVNPNPDIAPDSGAAGQAKAAGLSYNEFIGKIVSLAVE